MKIELQVGGTLSFYGPGLGSRSLPFREAIAAAIKVSQSKHIFCSPNKTDSYHTDGTKPKRTLHITFI